MTAPPYILRARRNRPEARIARVFAFAVVIAVILVVMTQWVLR